MANKPNLRFFGARLLSLSSPFWVWDSFQLVLLLTAFGDAEHVLAGLVAYVVFVLVAARISCIYSGSYLYKFPGGLLV